MGLACASDKSWVRLVCLRCCECYSLEEEHVLMDEEERYGREGQVPCDPEARNSL